jgi:DNA polymerase-3 subunit gamma/tau
VARTKTTGAAAPDPDTNAGYTVVARRYRPQQFADVVGQELVVQALRNAIRMNRVTHAYLFSGTRGVGKTSMARIFAKCLNCVTGPTETPCDRCDICQSIATGQDVDVIEIDGASNNGVEAVRELRQNAGLRPSRARFKIYYIDEVHMLSTGAFNALLKTLEEPPEHVKFFFATTEPNKIPITVLSRCQRYDFAGIAPEQIIDSLAGICAKEGIQADRDALQAVSRRAGGSMRDAQSLLEQLLSFGEKRLTSELVHRALGIAPDDRVLDLIEALADHDAGRALRLLDGSAAMGVQPVELLNAVLEFLRDVMVVAVGAEIDALAAGPSQRDRVRAIADRWPLDSVLAALQILAEARGRLRGSPHGRLLVELALCRVARLEDLAELGELVSRLSDLEADGLAPKKKRPEPEPRPVIAPRAVEPAPTRPVAAAADPAPPEARVAHEEAAPPPVGPVAPALDLETARVAWKALPERVGAGLGIRLSQVGPRAVEPPNVVVIGVPPRYNYIADRCDAADSRARIEQALKQLLDRAVTVRFERDLADPEPQPERSTRAERADELADDPFVRQAVELFDARRVKIEFDDEAEPVG